MPDENMTDVPTVALDAEGGDHAPGEIVAGAVAAAGPGVRVLLVGRPEILEPELTEGENPYISVIPSSDVIGSTDDPARAVRSRADSSIAVGARLVAEGKAHAFVSAGSTGAVLAAGLLIVRRIPGIKRPAIVTLLPGQEGTVVFLDAGANADCRAEHLLEFGSLGAVFARAVVGIPQPRVGLLNIGEEESKGNELALNAHRMLAQSDLDFIGNVEGRGILSGQADVVVTDGFTGNVVLKVLEGTSTFLLSQVKQAALGSLRGKAGGALLKPALKGLRARLDPEEYGGTYLLGVHGLVVICHGNSSRVAIANALRFAALGVREDVVGQVERALGDDSGSSAGGGS